MSIKLVVTAGYGNGTFNGTIADVVTRGYTIGEAALVALYLANVLCNPSPTLNRLANPSPIITRLCNPSPTKDLLSG